MKVTITYRNTFVRRLVKTTAVALVFLTGLTIGNKSAHSEDAAPADVVAQVAEAQRTHNTPCWAEWSATTPVVPGNAARVGDTGRAGWDVLCAR